MSKASFLTKKIELIYEYRGSKLKKAESTKMKSVMPIQQ